VRQGTSIRAALSFLVAALLVGCGGSGSSNHGSVTTGRGDAAVFTIDGRTVAVRETGTASVKVDGAPEIDHDGPVGCAGRYFTADFTDNVRMMFRYGSQDAYLLVGSDLYYIGEAPERRGAQLEWNTTANGHQIDVRATCPAPAPGPRLAKTQTPEACSILTRALAAKALHEPVRPGKLVIENPELTYCAYQSVDTSFDRNRRVSLSVTVPGELRQLSSWSQPRIAGLGGEAHGGDPSDGLAVARGKLGMEITISLGTSASDARNLAAEEALARTLLPRLRG
jgi:hypothetical protein